MNQSLLKIIFGLWLVTFGCLRTSLAEENYTEPKSCDKPIKEAVLSECKKLKAMNPEILDAGFAPNKKGFYEVPVSADTKEGLYSIDFRVDVNVSKDKKTCKVTSIREFNRHPHP